MLAAALLAACGSDGSDGQNGQNGTSAAVNTTIEPAGENCANGGIKIEVLEDGVVQSGKTQFICNGAAGEQGGQGNPGDPGSAGQNGFNAAVRTTEIEAGAICANGGYKVETGLDKNQNGKLDDDEVQADLTKTICNGTTGAAGTNGFNVAIRTTEITEGETCINGGYKIETGLDKNGNNKLDDGEVQAELTQTICNGLNGDAGLNGLNAIAGTTYIPVYEGCTYGANKVSFGIDQNANDELEETEVAMSQYLCADACGEGYDYLDSAQKCVTSRETEEPEGDNCQFGGTKVEYIVDANGDGEIQTSEVVDTKYVCTAGICPNSDEEYVAARGKCVSIWAKVPAGVFTYTMIGYDEVQMEAYSIMKTEVTVEAFKTCVEAGNCTSEHFAIYDANDADKNLCNYGRADHENHPMNCVDFAGAEEFCAFKAGRLPSKAEWTYAAYMTDSGTVSLNIYPWGNSSAGTHCSKANFYDENDSNGQYCDEKRFVSEPVGTAPVGSYPEGATSLGLQDILGNVREMTTQTNGTDIWSMGGSFDEKLLIIYQGSYNAKTRKIPARGFRCVKDPAPSNNDANP